MARDDKPGIKNVLLTEENTSDINEESSQSELSETEIIGLPRLETLLERDDFSDTAPESEILELDISEIEVIITEPEESFPEYEEPESKYPETDSLESEAPETKEELLLYLVLPDNSPNTLFEILSANSDEDQALVYSQLPGSKSSTKPKRRKELLINNSPQEDENKTKKLSELKELATQEEKPRSSFSNFIKNFRRKKNRAKSNVPQQVNRGLEKRQSDEEYENLIFTNVSDNLINAGVILYNNLTKQMQDNGTLRVEYLMTVLGSLAGYSTQAATREKMINQLMLSEDQVFSIIETADGSKYYFGDAIDRTLQKDKHSVWYMAATAALKLTGKVNCNINEVVRYNVRNLGKKNFGIPRVPNNLRTDKLPAYYVENLWIPIQKGLERFTDEPLDWPIIFGVALQKALISTKNVLDPNISLRIIMESAVPTSAMDLVPVQGEQILTESERDITIARLRNEIGIIMNTLKLRNLPDEQKSILLNELAEKNEQLYQLLS